MGKPGRPGGRPTRSCVATEQHPEDRRTRFRQSRPGVWLWHPRRARTPMEDYHGWTQPLAPMGRPPVDQSRVCPRSCCRPDRLREDALPMKPVPSEASYKARNCMSQNDLRGIRKMNTNPDQSQLQSSFGPRTSSFCVSVFLCFCISTFLRFPPFTLALVFTAWSTMRP